MPQYVAYQKNVVYALIKLSAKSHSFNILRTMVLAALLTANNLRGIKQFYYYPH